jgi:uncharacterized phiE125 gp8 family phage protein
MNPTVIVDVTEEPMTLGECYQHLRIDVDSDDPADSTLILAMLKASREYCENFAGLSFANKTLEIQFESFSDDMFIPFGPVTNIESATYENGEYDSDGLPTRVDLNYLFNPFTSKLSTSSDWPKGSNITIQYRAGYGLDSDAKQLPSVAKIAILLMLGHLYEHREDATERPLTAIPNGVESFLRPLRERLGMA